MKSRCVINHSTFYGFQLTYYFCTFDTGSRFYFVDGYAFEGEEDGVNILPYFVDQELIANSQEN